MECTFYLFFKRRLACSLHSVSEFDQFFFFKYDMKLLSVMLKMDLPKQLEVRTSYLLHTCCVLLENTPLQCENHRYIQGR